MPKPAATDAKTTSAAGAKGAKAGAKPTAGGKADKAAAKGKGKK